MHFFSTMARQINLNGSKFHLVPEIAKDKAKHLFDSAEILASQNKYNSAYSLLVFSIEECAKAKIVQTYLSNLTEKQVASANNRDPQGIIDIEEKTVQKMFSSHVNKHLIVLTQTIFSFTNTFDQSKKKSIFNAIMNEDPSLDTDVKEVLSVFKGLQEKREKSLFAEVSGEDFGITEDEYLKLYRFAKISVESLHKFVGYANHKYEDVEKKIKTMLSKV